MVELTSGNTGTGLAIACAAMGHPFVAVMSAGNSVERARMMRALGAEVVLVEWIPLDHHKVVYIMVALHQIMVVVMEEVPLLHL